MKTRPVCVVLTQDDAVKYFGSHDPIMNPAGGAFGLNIKADPTSVLLHFCKRCGVAYVDAHTITFAEASPDSVPSSGGGQA